MGLFKRKYRRKINGKLRTKTIWYIDYYDDSGRRTREAIGPSKKLAEKALAKRRIEITEGKYNIKKKKPDITFNELADEFINNYSKVNKRSWKRDVLSMRSLKTFFGKKKLKAIKPSHVEKYKKMRTKRIKRSTCNRELSCLKTCLNYGIREGYIDTNVSRFVKLFREKNQRLVFLSVDEIHRLIRVAPEYFRPFLIVALSTGMRRGELLGLKWKDIDFDSNIIYLEQPKSGELEEVILDDDLKVYLLNLKKHSSHESVFINSRGRPYKDVRTIFKSCLRRAKITKNVNLHSLRHSFGAHHAMNGTPMPTLMKYMRHRSISMTMRYVHLARDHKQQRANIFQRKLGIIPKEGENINEKWNNGHYLDTLNKVSKVNETVSNYVV